MFETQWMKRREMRQFLSLLFAVLLVFRLLPITPATAASPFEAFDRIVAENLCLPTSASDFGDTQHADDQSADHQVCHFCRIDAPLLLPPVLAELIDPTDQHTAAFWAAPSFGPVASSIPSDNRARAPPILSV
jgi:hypothetical protein